MDLDDERMSRKDPLIGLFQEVGRRQAPSGLEAKVMARIEAVPSASESSLPLIGKGGWWILAALAGILVTYAFTLPTTIQSATPAVTWLTKGTHDLFVLISSRWTIGILFCTAGLWLLDGWASEKFSVKRQH
ncbi:MAG: hypothetical protein ACOH13_13605 [Flavobacteriales bacterium]